MPRSTTKRYVSRDLITLELTEWWDKGTVVMNHPPQSVYQQVIERTKGGFFRTQVLR